MWYVPWNFTTYMWGCSCYDRKSAPEDCTMRALFSETVPVLFYYTDKSLSQLIRRCFTNFETFSQFFPVLCMIICNNIITGVCLPMDLWFKYRFTIISIIKEPIFNVIRIADMDIPVLYLRFPYLFLAYK